MSTYAEDFQRDMEDTWGDDSRVKYNELSNATETVKLWGGRQLDPIELNGEPAHVWIFPDESRIMIADHGAAIEILEG